MIHGSMRSHCLSMNLRTTMAFHYIVVWKETDHLSDMKIVYTYIYIYINILVIYLNISGVYPYPLLLLTKCWSEATFVNQWPFYEFSIFQYHCGTRNPRYIQRYIQSNIIPGNPVHQNIRRMVFSDDAWKGFLILPVWAKFGTDLDFLGYSQHVLVGSMYGIFTYRVPYKSTK